MIDLNLTGSISLIQASKTNYLPFATQVTLTLLTVLATLGGVWLKNRLDIQLHEATRLREEDQRKFRDKQEAYVNFLRVFSIPTTDYDKDRYIEYSNEMLNAALKAAEFGEVILEESKDILFPKFIINHLKEIQPIQILSLNDMIKAILRIRYDEDLTLFIKDLLEQAKLIGSKNFGPLLLSSLTSSPEEKEKRTSTLQRIQKKWGDYIKKIC
jgi:hypothetical protein